jgi:Uma2 family endonuclease
VQRALQGLNRIQDGAGWWIEVDAEVRLGDALFVPDLSGWRVERVPEFPDDNPILVTPDWCCEVLSPTTARADRTEKLPSYAQRGVGWVWLVDPSMRAVEVYACEGGRPTLVQTAVDDATIALQPFGIDIPLCGWWLPAQP